jgi:8-oxo-dGTP pyrophosphatase MutT (NUDIX family)
MGRIEYLNDPAAPKPNSLVPACGVLVVDGEGRVLLQRRRDTGQWAIPMGKQELGETPSQCALRETEEETGIRAEITGILGVYSDPGHIVAYTDGEIRQEWELILLGRPISGTPTVNDEASDVRWFTTADLGGLDIHPTQWRQLRDWLSQAWPHVD